MERPGVGPQEAAWTRIREAREGSAEAIDRLIVVYWKPVYFFLRRQGRDAPEAQEIARSFFNQALEPDFLRAVSSEKGRFRTYVLAALPHFLSQPPDAGTGNKRNGDFDFAQAEKELAAADPTPLGAFQSAWAVEVLARAMGRLRADTPTEDLALLTGSTRPDLSPADRKNRLVRLRGRLRECLKEELRPTVDQESDLESEIRELFAAMT